MGKENALVNQINRRGVLVSSMVMAIIAVLLLVQALVAAEQNVVPEQAGLGQDDSYQPTEPITGTDQVLEEYVAMHTLTEAQLQELVSAGLVSVEEAYPPEQADEDEVDAPANLGGSSKEVDRSQATAGSTLQYTIVISNSATDFPAATAVITDALPAELTYDAGTLSVTPSSFAQYFQFTDNVLTGTAAVNPQQSIFLTFDATLTDTVTVGAVVENVVQITGTGSLLTPSAQTTVISTTVPQTTTLYMPLAFRPVPAVTLQSSRPDGNNEWTLSWSSAGNNVTDYEVQESHDPNFGSLTGSSPGDIGNVTEYNVDRNPSSQNEFYYRVRGKVGSSVGSWSNVIHVVGGYRDDFTANTTGWQNPSKPGFQDSIRRTTLIEKVRAFYEIKDGDDWLIMQVEDSWDWGIASPKVKAPSLPYAIDYEAKVANRGNLVSLGVVFAGDWPGSICPDKSSVAGWYEHDLCFNHFFNINTIWYGPLKLLFERVDRLVWCPNCGGSPMKRLGDIDANDAVDYSGVNPDGWNRYRIEVREDSIKVYAAKRGEALKLQYTYTNLDGINWLDDPYVGVFASTDEYSNSTARFEYLQIMPLDN